MNTKRIAIFSVAGGVLAAMIAGATTANRRPLPPPAAPPPRAVDAKGAELATEIARLRERLRPSTAPAQPARNLFQFGGISRGAAAIESSPDNLPDTFAVPESAPAAPPLVLVGFATDGGVRSAIISGYGDIFLVRQGEPVGAHFRVATIGAEGVELTNLSDGTSLRLALK